MAIGYKDIHAAVNYYGPEVVSRIVRDASEAIEKAEKGIDLPTGFAYFSVTDWAAFNGAQRFANGVRPIVGEIEVTGGPATVLVARDDTKVRVELHLPHPDNSDVGSVWAATRPDLDTALHLVGALIDISGALPSEAILEELGFNI